MLRAKNVDAENAEMYRLLKLNYREMFKHVIPGVHGIRPERIVAPPLLCRLVRSLKFFADDVMGELSSSTHMR